MLLGCIGDDFTGSSDLANTLTKQGMCTVQYVGIPHEDAPSHVEAGVVALKSRSIAVEDAVRQSVEALHWLQRQGCEQFFFKYCSTFDSTPQGNIGPVIDAIADILDARQVIICPAFPGAGRSLYQGHLFVNDRLLNESGMENHPITPMIDPDIRRWLESQTSNNVAHIAAHHVFEGTERIKRQLDQTRSDVRNLIVIDALRDQDLMEIGMACAGLPLITGGSGIALGLPDNFRVRGLLKASANDWSGQEGRCVALAGSCSSATRSQIIQHQNSNPALEISAADVVARNLSPQNVADWLIEQNDTPLAYSSANPVRVREVQEEFGSEATTTALEDFFAETAKILVDHGVTKIISAGGETSGAIVEGLNLASLEIGPEICTGVPALRASNNLVLALKSGNFGGVDFFADAAKLLAGKR